MTQEEKERMMAMLTQGGMQVGQLSIGDNNTMNYYASKQQTGHDTQIEAAGQGKKQLSEDQLARAIENCQQYFWGNSSYAVVFCVSRDLYGMDPNKSAFERMIELLPYSKSREFTCPAGTLANAFSDNPIYNDKIDKWDTMNALERVIKLRDELKKQLEL